MGTSRNYAQDLLAMVERFKIIAEMKKGELRKIQDAGHIAKLHERMANGKKTKPEVKKDAGQGTQKRAGEKKEMAQSMREEGFEEF